MSTLEWQDLHNMLRVVEGPSSCVLCWLDSGGDAGWRAGEDAGGITEVGEPGVGEASTVERSPVSETKEDIFMDLH